MADYGVDMDAYPKRQAIQDFLAYAGDRLHEKGCVVTADVFGTIIGSETDVQTVGQDYMALGQTVDAISPMVYPSHYANGVFGLKVPDANPYETVLTAMQFCRRTAGDSGGRAGCGETLAAGIYRHLFLGTFPITEHRSGNRFRRSMMPVMRNGSCGMRQTAIRQRDCLVQTR